MFSSWKVQSVILTKAEVAMIKYSSNAQAYRAMMNRCPEYFNNGSCAQVWKKSISKPTCPGCGIVTTFARNSPEVSTPRELTSWKSHCEFCFRVRKLFKTYPRNDCVMPGHTNGLTVPNEEINFSLLGQWHVWPLSFISPFPNFFL